MTTCPRCRDAIDPTTGRHIDEDGQVMSYREDLIHCRPAPDVGSLSWWAAQDDKTGCPPYIARLIAMSKNASPVHYQGYDII